MIFNRLLIIISCLLMIKFILSLLTSFSNNIGLGIEMNIYLFTLTSVCLLIRNGEMIHSKQFIYIIINILIHTTGATFQFMHWPGAIEMITFSTYGIGLAYLFYFIMKKSRNWISYLKVFYVASCCIPNQFLLTSKYNLTLSEELMDFILIVNSSVLIFLTFHHIVFEKAWKLYVREE